jgi:hypothetical protein
VSGRDRFFLPGWWKFWDQGPQWSPTARRRIGVPEAPTEPGDWHLWEAELRQPLEHPPAGTGADSLTGADVTATFTSSTSPSTSRPPGAPAFADELAEQLARDAIENPPADKTAPPGTDGGGEDQ